MNKYFALKWLIIFIVLSLVLFYPDSVFAQWGGSGFESKMQGLTSKLISVILPLLIILGLVYAVFLALTGDGNFKGRLSTIVICSVIGFLAPQLINWLKSIVGGP